MVVEEYEDPLIKFDSVEKREGNSYCLPNMAQAKTLVSTK